MIKGNEGGKSLEDASHSDISATSAVPLQLYLIKNPQIKVFFGKTLGLLR